LIPANEIADIRRDAARLLLDNGVVWTPVYASDGGGGETVTWTESDPIPCRLAPAGGKVGADPDGKRLDERTTHVVTLPFDAEIEAESRIVIEGEAWSVTAAPQRLADRFVRRVEVALFDSEAGV
jgi:hypothetical protein